MFEKNSQCLIVKYAVRVETTVLQRVLSTAITLNAIRFSITNLGFSPQNERRLFPFWSSVLELHAVCSLGEKRNSHLFSRKGNAVPHSQNHNPNEFQDDECPKTYNKNITETLE